MLKGIYFRETDLARLIGPTMDSAQAVWVPQARTTTFRKLPYSSDAERLPGAPRRCIFDVEPWLMKKPEYSRFETAKHLVDYT